MHDHGCSCTSNVASQSIDEVFFTSSQSIHNAVIDDDLERVRKILQKSPGKIDELDSAGYTALLYAKSASVARLLLDHGANIDAVTNEGRRTLLHRASIQGNKEIVELLLTRHAKIMTDADGNLPLEHHQNS